MRVVAAVALVGVAAWSAGAQTPTITVDQLSGRALAAHVVSRLTFGARPGEVDRVATLGVDRWIDAQLYPDSLDDRGARAALAGCRFWTDPVSSVAAELSSPISLTTETMVAGSARRATVFLAPGFFPLAMRDSARRNERFGSALLSNGQLVACRLARVEASERQLAEVMTDFWQNHFSVSNQKMLTRGALVEWDRSTIGPRVLGRFRDLLGAVAHSPLMLHYLDNALSSAGALNENYGRELLELHTLGVDGGYTQADVVNVARAFTGWSHTMSGTGGRLTISQMATVAAPVFRFDADRHDKDAKLILGDTLRGGRGLEDGEHVLDILARHPSTARHIARKLVVRFVSDSPPPTLVERAAATYTRTDGNIREVLRTIFFSPEFRSPSVVGAKVKRPIELVLSLRRALAAPVDTAAEMIDFLIALEQTPFGRLTPEGWPEVGTPWMTAGAMRARLALVSDVANGRAASIPIESWPMWRLLVTENFERQVDGVIDALLAGQASAQTRAVLHSARPPTTGAGDAGSALRELVAIALSSPEFQRR
jgi:uncharacterized protein (DUF1800 family)